jgi:hypothetical protein
MTTELIQLTNQPKPEVNAEVTDLVAPIAGSETSVTRFVEPRPAPQNTGRVAVQRTISRGRAPESSACIAATTG